MKTVLVAFTLFAIVLLTGCTTNSGGGTNGTTGGPLRITTTALPEWEAPGAATYKIDVAGGVPPYSFELSGALPEGFNLGPDGTIGGLARLNPGSSRSVSPPFTVVVRDGAGNVTQATYTIVIVENAGLRILIGLPVTCFANVRCDEALASAQGGTEPYHYQSDSFAEGAPPMGTIVDVNGHLVGTPSRAGEYMVGICVVDSLAHSKCDHASVTVEESVNITGTWSGPYGETETSDYCTIRNEGTLTLVLRADGDSFSGSSDDVGAPVSATPTQEGINCESTPFHHTGTAEGTVVGDTISGTIMLYNSETVITLPFTATMTEDTMTGSYAGTVEAPDWSSRLSGSFRLVKTRPR
ncbi:hypothetical protein HYS54_00140 [Candidatus Micrarchaeota archaeon]|nr:hypothetical protein [Candidatus Micrarchaeota archaeon]